MLIIMKLKFQHCFRELDSDYVIAKSKKRCQIRFSILKTTSNKLISKIL
jgi:hypothetical protein